MNVSTASRIASKCRGTPLYAPSVFSALAAVSSAVPRAAVSMPSPTTRAVAVDATQRRGYHDKVGILFLAAELGGENSEGSLCVASPMKPRNCVTNGIIGVEKTRFGGHWGSDG